MPLIQDYTFGSIKINDRIFAKDLIVLPEEIFPNWWRVEGHKLSLDDLKQIFHKNLDFLIIGTGYSGLMKVPENVVEELTKKGLKVFLLNSSRAVEKFNELSVQNKKTALAIHLTC